MGKFQVSLLNFLLNLFSFSFFFFLCPRLIRGNYFFWTVYIDITLSNSRLQLPRWRWIWRYLSKAIQCIYLPVFMKTNLTRFPIIWVKKGQKAGFFFSWSARKSHQSRERELWTLLDWRKRSISEIWLDIYFFCLVRLTGSDFIYNAIYFNETTFLWSHKDNSINKRLYPFCLLYFFLSCGNIQMLISMLYESWRAREKAINDSRKNLYF